MHDNEVADVLSQVVDVGPSSRQDDLGAAVSRHVSSRPAQPAPQANPETVAALRKLAADPPTHLYPEETADLTVTPLSVCVDFNDLLDRLGEPEVWQVLGKLKDLFG